MKNKSGKAHSVIKSVLKDLNDQSERTAFAEYKTHVIKKDGPLFPLASDSDSRSSIDQDAMNEFQKMFEQKSRVESTSETIVSNQQSSKEIFEQNNPLRGKAPAKFESASEAPHLVQKLQTSEALKSAQGRILELEKEVDRIRQENEALSSVNEAARIKAEEFYVKLSHAERDFKSRREEQESELKILQNNLLVKDQEIQRFRLKLDDLESRLASDLRKIRVRERELENRLEIARLEKNAILKSKDDNIIELKRKIEGLSNETETARARYLEAQSYIDMHKEQINRTVRTLRLALTQLELPEAPQSSITIAPLKKAE